MLGIANGAFKGAFGKPFLRAFLSNFKSFKIPFTSDIVITTRRMKARLKIFILTESYRRRSIDCVR